MVEHGVMSASFCDELSSSKLRPRQLSNGVDVEDKDDDDDDDDVNEDCVQANIHDDDDDDDDDEKDEKDDDDENDDDDDDENDDDDDDATNFDGVEPFHDSPNIAPLEIAYLDYERHMFAAGFSIPDSPRIMNWRMKRRMRTVSVALVACLNIGVDPPDIIKAQPYARHECWVDPLALPAPKTLATIGSRLQQQYERWQPRARYALSLDQTVDDIRKLCSAFRRSSRKERILFHFNGHGVPKPTTNGEIWVFNKNLTQYIPLSIFDLQTWMSSPSIYVFDCNNAGIIVDSFIEFALQRDSDDSPSLLQDSIILASCAADQLLPMNPSLPADVFTACLTTPIKMALIWFTMRSVLTSVTPEQVGKIPGRPNDRKTPLGELNWIFTSITDTIAWHILPADLFQSLFRQDLLVASLFRNFFLAERILSSMNCNPVSIPALPRARQHQMWDSWDLATDSCCSQLEAYAANPSFTFKPSSFFTEQLTAFEVWLEFCGTNEESKPMQLPVVLQVLLSQAHRLRALRLLARFLDKGNWAVNLALSVGIFPYVLKLLQSPTVVLRDVLVFIWAKILCLDKSCQVELIKDKYETYFITHLSSLQHSSSTATSIQALLCVMILCRTCDTYAPGQSSIIRSDAPIILYSLLSSSSYRLRQWACLAFAQLWRNHSLAHSLFAEETSIARSNASQLYSQTHNALCSLALSDAVVDVRACATCALGMWFGGTANLSSHFQVRALQLAKRLAPLVYDASPLVRVELSIALSALILAQRDVFIKHGVHGSQLVGHSEGHKQDRNADNQALHCAFLWRVVQTLCDDPFKEVAGAALSLVQRMWPTNLFRTGSDNTINKNDDDNEDDDDEDMTSQNNARDVVDSGLFAWCVSAFSRPSYHIHDADELSSYTMPEDDVVSARLKAQTMWRYRRRVMVEECAQQLESQTSLPLAKQIAFFQTSFQRTTHVVLHPFEKMLVACDTQSIGVWNYGSCQRVNKFRNGNERGSHISSLKFINNEHISLLAVGSDDGVVRVWKDSHSESECAKMITSWITIPNMKRRLPGLVMDWQQRRSRLITTGNTDFARIWDLEQEACVQDVSVGTSSCVTCITGSGHSDVLYVGCGDHSLRLIDLRVAGVKPVIKIHTQSGWVLNVHKQKRIMSPRLLAGSINGDLIVWDPRMPRLSLKTMKVKESVSAFEFHDFANLIALGSLKQFVRVMDTNINTLNIIRYHDGFLGQRIGPISCLGFHRYKPLLACGSRDQYVSIIASSKSI